MHFLCSCYQQFPVLFWHVCYTQFLTLSNPCPLFPGNPYLSPLAASVVYGDFPLLIENKGVMFVRGSSKYKIKTFLDTNTCKKQVFSIVLVLRKNFYDPFFMNGVHLPHDWMPLEGGSFILVAVLSIWQKCVLL